MWSPADARTKFPGAGGLKSPSCTVSWLISPKSRCSQAWSLLEAVAHKPSQAALPASGAPSVLPFLSLHLHLLLSTSLGDCLSFSSSTLDLSQKTEEAILSLLLKVFFCLFAYLKDR